MPAPITAILSIREQSWSYTVVPSSWWRHARSGAVDPENPTVGDDPARLGKNGRMTTTFTRMDESTAEQWAVIGAETMSNQPRVADEVLSMLRRLEGITDGFATNQLVHSLQTATLAERAGADQEMVVASLCHDIGKIVSVFGHPEIAASILRPYVRDDVYQVIRAHQDFQGRHYYHHFGGDVNARDRYQGRTLVRPRRAVRRRVGSDRVRSRRPLPSHSNTSSPWCARSSPGPGADRGDAARSERPVADDRHPFHHAAGGQEVVADDVLRRGLSQNATLPGSHRNLHCTSGIAAWRCNRSSSPNDSPRRHVLDAAREGRVHVERPAARLGVSPHHGVLGGRVLRAHLLLDLRWLSVPERTGEIVQGHQAVDLVPWSRRASRS